MLKEKILVYIDTVHYFLQIGHVKSKILLFFFFLKVNMLKEKILVYIDNNLFTDFAKI